MMSITHAAIALAGATLFLGEPSPLVIGLAAIGSQIPDLDSTKSLAGRILYPVAAWAESRFTHRTITHSLLVSGTLLILSSPLFYYYGAKTWLALPLGHLLSCFSDTFTKEGVALFYPSPVRAIYGLNPNYRLRTGSSVEYWVLALFIAFTIWLINLQSSGGLMLSFNHLLGLKEGIEQVYNKYGSTNHIWVTIKGYKTSDRTRVNNEFFLVGQSLTDFVVQDRSGLYKTEEQIFVDRITAKPKQAATTSEETIVLNEDDVTKTLSRLHRANKRSAIYLTGSLEIDEPDEILKTSEPGQFEALAKSGGSITLELCPIRDAIALLKDQFGYGTLTAKMITPKPEGL